MLYRGTNQPHVGSVKINAADSAFSVRINMHMLQKHGQHCGELLVRNNILFLNTGKNVINFNRLQCHNLRFCRNAPDAEHFRIIPLGTTAERAVRPFSHYQYYTTETGRPKDKKGSFNGKYCI